MSNCTIAVLINTTNRQLLKVAFGLKIFIGSRQSNSILFYGFDVQYKKKV